MMVPRRRPHALLAVVVLAAAATTAVSSSPLAKQKQSSAHAEQVWSHEFGPADSDDSERHGGWPLTSNTTTTPPTNTTSAPPGGGSGAYNIAFVFAALPAVLVALTARRFLRQTLFLAGYGATAYVFYIFSPHVFTATPFCCNVHDKGTELGLVVSSLAFGIIGGVVALLVLKIGLFAIGGCLGFGVGLIGLATPLAESQQAFFNRSYGLPVYYGSLVLFFGILTILAQKFFIVLTTAWAGTLVVFLGIDYFARLGLAPLVTQLVDEVRDMAVARIHGNTTLVPFDTPAITWQLGCMLGAWGVAAIVAMVIQYRYPRSKMDVALVEEERSLLRRQQLRDKYAKKWKQRPRQQGRGRKQRRHIYEDESDDDFDD